MEAKFISQTGRDFVIDIDGQQYTGTIPEGMEGKEDEAILAFSQGKIEELQKSQEIAVDSVAETSYKENDVIISDGK